MTCENLACIHKLTEASLVQYVTVSTTARDTHIDNDYKYSSGEHLEWHCHV